MRRKVKFEIQIQGFSVKFEGDEEQAQTAVLQVGQGLAGLASLPGHMLHSKGSGAVPQQMIGSDANLGAVPTTSEAKSTTPRASKVQRTKGPKGESPQGLIETLVSEGYLSEERSAEDIVGELSKKGYAYETGAISTPLTRLTRKKILTRDNKGGKHFFYKKAEAPPQQEGES